MIFFSAQTRGFYTNEIHGENMPDDVVEISDKAHAALLAGQSAGQLIAPNESGQPELVDPPAPTEEQIKASLVDAVQKHMDAAAVAYGYDDIQSAVSYAEEPIVPKFQTEGRAFRAWRSLVWAHSASVLEAVQAGTRAIPTRDELIAELPPFDQVTPS